MTRIQELRWNRKFALWCLSAEKPRHGGLCQNSSEGWCFLRLGLLTARSRSLIIHLTTGPTCFLSKLDRQGTLASVPRLLQVVWPWANPTTSPAFPFPYLECEEAGLVYFLRFFPAIKFQTMIPYLPILLPVDWFPASRKKSSFPPKQTISRTLKPMHFPQKCMGYRAASTSTLGGQWEGASQLGSLANLRRGLILF